MARKVSRREFLQLSGAVSAALLVSPMVATPAHRALAAPSGRALAPNADVHPRMLFTEALIPELQRRATAPAYASFYEQMLATANSAPDTVDWFHSAEGTDGDWEQIYHRLPGLSLSYRLTKNEKYKNKVRNYTLKVTDDALYPEWGDQQGGAMANAMGLIGIGYAYDWSYELFSDAEKEQIRSKLQSQADKLYTQFHTNLTGSLAYWKHDYQNNHMQIRIEGLLTATTALYGDAAGDADDSRVATMYDFAVTQLATMTQWIAPDGSQHEGPAYMSFGDEHVIRSLTLYEFVSGVSLWSDTEHNIGYFKAYEYFPGLVDLAPYSDYSGGLQYFNNYLYKIADKYRDGVLQGLFNKAYAVQPGSFVYSVWDFLYYDDILVPVENTLPNWRYFPDLEYANFRTGWDSADISIHLKSGPPGGHKLNEWRLQHDAYVNIGHDKPDAANFCIAWAGKRWGDYPPYDKQPRLTEYHNTLLVDGAGQHGIWTKFAQPFDGMEDQARITEFFGSPGYGLTTGDIHNAYDNLSTFNRNVLMVAGRYFVVFDEVASSSGARDFQFRFHNQGTWTGDLDSGYTITQDTDSMEVYMLLPLDKQGTIGPAEKEQEGTLLAVSPATATEATNFLMVLAPVLDGEGLQAKPQVTQDAEGTKLTVTRGGQTDTLALRSSVGAITTAAVRANARALLATLTGGSVDTALIVKGTSLTLPSLDLASSADLNLRYEKLPTGFSIWATKPLIGGTDSATLRVSELARHTAYALERGDGTTDQAITDSQGGLSMTLDLTAERSLTVVETLLYLEQLMQRHVQNGDLNGPLVRQLQNSYDQAKQQLAQGAREHAIQHMEDFLKHLHNNAMQRYVSPEAMATLTAAANALIAAWKL